MNKFEIVDVTLDNINKYGIGCSNNPKYKGYVAKLQWLKKRFSEGLILKVLLENGKSAGFIECIPGEYTWRGVEAPGYLVIHCIYIYAKKNKGIGLGSKLITACIEYAKHNKMLGVVSLVSAGSFIASKDVFKKSQFKFITDNKYPKYEIAYINLQDRSPPTFSKTIPPLKTYKGLHIIYSDQCPYITKNIQDLKEMAISEGFQPIMKKISTAKEAQQLPSPYGTFMIIYNGVIKAEHYISKTRLRNILQKEL